MWAECHCAAFGIAVLSQQRDGNEHGAIGKGSLLMTNRLRHTAVLGLGTMGHGIAQVMASGGCQVRAYDNSATARDSLKSRIEANLAQAANAGLANSADTQATLDRIVVCESESEALVAAEFVTEAVAEDLAVKQELFQRIEGYVDHHTILASNTSSYPMTEIAARMARPQRAIVTHWFNPPHIIPVVEVVPGASTAAATAEQAVSFLQTLGKLPVRLKQELPGFLVNRVQMAMLREVWDLLDRGVASAEDIDLALSGSMGLRLAALGPLAVCDYAGWDVCGRVYQNLVPELRADAQLPQSIQQLLDDRRFGAKAGRGVFEYPAAELGERLAQRDQTYLQLRRVVGGANAAPNEVET